MCKYNIIGWTIVRYNNDAEDIYIIKINRDFIGFLIFFLLILLLIPVCKIYSYEININFINSANCSLKMNYPSIY